MHELSTLLAVKLMDKLSGQQTADAANIENLVSGLSDDKNSLHLCLGRIRQDISKPSNFMTPSEYRVYIETQINLLKRHEQQETACFTIHITESGLHLMQGDKDYEKYVLTAVLTAFSQPYPAAFAENCLLYFDTRENSCCMNWSSMDKLTVNTASFGNPAAVENEAPEDASQYNIGQTDTSENTPPQDISQTDAPENIPTYNTRTLQDTHQYAVPSADRSPEKSGNTPLKELSCKEYKHNRIHLPYAYYMPVSRYERILYAYNIMPEEWMQQKKE